MKIKYLIVMLCLTVGLLGASTAMAFTGTWTAGTGINNTVHDLSTGNPGNGAYNPEGENRICIFCHAPHNTWLLATVNGGSALGGDLQAPQQFTYLPLWNHALTTLYNSYQTYYNGPGEPQSGPRSSQAIANGMYPGSTSLLCLSCHDGSAAVNSYGNPTQQPASDTYAGTTMMAPQYSIGAGGNLQNHHPIGFDYDAVQLADPEIRPSGSTTLSNYGGAAQSISEHLYGGTTTGFCDKQCLECGSCHSVHNTGNTGERLLWRSDAGSALCLTCHAKGVYSTPETVGVTGP